MKALLYIFSCAFIFTSCKEDTIPKPPSYLSLQYPVPKYKSIDSQCTYSFENNTISNVKFKDGCNALVDYPSLNGTLFLTYRSVNNNINTLLRDAQKLTYEHVRKADDIIEEKYINDQQNVYGMFYDVSGNAASQSQFYVTDSINHFITGSIYFNVKPNYDSIYPAATYLKNDIRHLMETIQWQ